MARNRRKKAMSLSAQDHRLLVNAVFDNDADAAAAAIQNGANVNAVRNHWTPLMIACRLGYDQINGILLNTGADARWRSSEGWSAIMVACSNENGRLSTVQLLINHDSSLLETVDDHGWTPLFRAISRRHSDIVRFLLDFGADANHVDPLRGVTALMIACKFDSLAIVRLLLAAGVDVEARDSAEQTALHYAARRDNIEVLRELIIQRHANMFAEDIDGWKPFDAACASWESDAAVNPLLELYGNKLTHDHRSIAFHALLKVAEYSFADDENFHPPLDPLRIILPLGKLTLKHLRTLLHTMDLELIRNRDDTGMLPIHIACQTNAPVEVLSLLVELDPTTLRITDFTGAMPIHLLCGTTAGTEYASVRYLVEQGGVGTLAALNQQGAVPLHILSGSTNPPLRALQYLLQSFPGSVAVQTNGGQYPFMMAAVADCASTSLSVIYELVRAYPGSILTTPKIAFSLR